MAKNPPEAIARLVRTYKGIEDFYFLNHAGQLGYISGGSLELIRENFEGLKGEGGQHRRAGAEVEVDAFRDTLARSSDRLPLSPDAELGHLLPGEGRHPWKSATLVLADWVGKRLADSILLELQNKNIDLPAAERRRKRMSSERGLHQGLEELFDFNGTFGNHPYFPILYYRNREEQAAHANASPLRVLNLKSINALREAGGGKMSFEPVFAYLKDRLYTRRALDRSRRVENRLRLVAGTDTLNTGDQRGLHGA